jgi:hypothetical protein
MAKKSQKAIDEALAEDLENLASLRLFTRGKLRQTIDGRVVTESALFILLSKLGPRLVSDWEKAQLNYLNDLRNEWAPRDIPWPRRPRHEKAKSIRSAILGLVKQWDSKHSDRHGMVSGIASHFGISRTTVYKYIGDDR